MTGQIYGAWTVLSLACAGKHTRWNCRCSCGVEKSVCSSDLRRGKTSKCDACSRKQNAKHGMHDTPTWRTWSGIISRCSTPSTTRFENYGGRGIDVCARWRASFTNFLDDMGERPAGMSIDRIDVDGNYEPQNCRWATGIEQARNTRRNHFITANGETLSLAAWVERTGLCSDTIRNRIRNGLTAAKAVTEPKRSPYVVGFRRVPSGVRSRIGG